MDGRNYLSKITHFCCELKRFNKINALLSRVDKVTQCLCLYCISNRMFPLCNKEVSRVFLECFRRVLRVLSVSFSHKNVIKKLMTMSKNPAFSQKLLEDRLRLPERQELFAGLISILVGLVFQLVRGCRR